jgi:transmembrane sensor
MDELIDRARRGEATSEEMARLDVWRRASPENDRSYRDVVRLLDAGHALGTVAPVGAWPTAAEIVARAGAQRRVAGRGLVLRWAPWAIAAAAAVVAAVALRESRAPSGAPELSWGAAEVVTGATELATVQLGEGSVVRLAPSSRLRVIAGRERAVSLEGRAFFAVQRIPGRPLRIQTRAGEAHVLGTRFELVSDAESMRVRVVEGRVALSTSANRIEVGAGQESGVRNGAVAQLTSVPTTIPVASWTGTFLAFQATPLVEVGREIERVYKTTVAISDSSLARETITATFTDRPLAEVVNVVCSVLNARCTVAEGRVRIER